MSGFCGRIRVTKLTWKGGVKEKDFLPLSLLFSKGAPSNSHVNNSWKGSTRGQKSAAATSVSLSFK